MKTALLRVTLQRQLAERRPGAGALGKAQIQMRIEVNNAHFFAGEGIQYPGAVTEGGLVAAAQYQRAFAGALAGGHRLAQRLMRGFQLVAFDANRAHIHAAVVALMAGHIGQRPA